MEEVSDMLDLAKYVPMIDVPDEEEVRFQSFGYEDNPFTKKIDEAASEEEDMGTGIVDEVDNPKEEEGLFTDEFMNQLTIPLKERESGNSGRKSGFFKKSYINIPVSDRKKQFDIYYDQVERINPEAKKYRTFLTGMAMKESQFDPTIKNPNAPAYGYFQFMQDGKRYNNISNFANTDVSSFLNNPIAQIQAAIKLAKSFESGFSKEDIETASRRGISIWGLLGGAWLAGNGGVRKWLKGQGNPSDGYWGGGGTNVEQRVSEFNF